MQSKGTIRSQNTETCTSHNATLTSFLILLRSVKCLHLSTRQHRHYTYVKSQPNLNSTDIIRSPRGRYTTVVLLVMSKLSSICTICALLNKPLYCTYSAKSAPDEQKKRAHITDSKQGSILFWTSLLINAFQVLQKLHLFAQYNLKFFF